MSDKRKDYGTTSILVSKITRTYTWKIENFQNWSELKSKSLCSPHFKFSDIDSNAWFLQLFQFSSAEYLDISLTLKAPNIAYYQNEVSVSFFIQSGTKRTCKHSATHDFHSPAWQHIYNKFLHIPTDCNDTLIIHCEIRKTNVSASEMNFQAENFQITGGQESKVLADLNNLLTSEKFSDIVLISSCGKKFQVHKNILAARSVVFSAMFENDMKEKENNLVEITDVDAEILEELLLFIYTGKVNNLKSAATGLLAAADKYAIEDLKIMCEKVLNDNVDVDNAVDILILADLHHANLLKEKVLRFITNNLKTVMETPAFKNLTNNIHPRLFEILGDMAKKN